MSVESRFEKMYKTGDIPWDLGRPDFNLINIVTKSPIPKSRALDIGCGTGDNAIWLAQKGFIVTGCDCSEIAIEESIKKNPNLM
mmetsp:Transcript_18474/g.8621  ORF Transcript_18474/g.8621 Transcript_18474/m.8621 type:complete len:84 (+) Transcript_18474:301-552(+)